MISINPSQPRIPSAEQASSVRGSFEGRSVKVMSESDLDESIRVVQSQNERIKSVDSSRVKPIANRSGIFRTVFNAFCRAIAFLYGIIRNARSSSSTISVMEKLEAFRKQPTISMQHPTIAFEQVDIPVTLQRLEVGSELVAGTTMPSKVDYTIEYTPLLQEIYESKPAMGRDLGRLLLTFDGTLHDKDKFSSLNEQERELHYFELFSSHLKEAGVRGLESLFKTDETGERQLNRAHPLVHLIPRILHQGLVSELQLLEGQMFGSPMGSKREASTAFTNIKVENDHVVLTLGVHTEQTYASTESMLQFDGSSIIQFASAQDLRASREVNQELVIPMDLAIDDGAPSSLEGYVMRPVQLSTEYSITPIVA